MVNRPDSKFVKVPYFCLVIHRSKKKFGRSFTFDAATAWNEPPDDVSYIGRPVYGV